MDKRTSGARSPPTWVQAIEIEGNNDNPCEIEQWARTLSSDCTYDSPESEFMESEQIKTESNGSKDSDYFIDIGTI
jgi:hypothetical protein